MTQSRSLNSKLVNWALFLFEYDLKFKLQKAVKGQAIADFLADHLVFESSKLHEDMPNETGEANTTSANEVWQMYFDKSSRMGLREKIMAGAGVILISSQGHVLPRAFSLTE
ncbi:hypothetical protein, partial [Paenibacillus apiarius]|uniref:hypothetical protein n=1 Tax=Paenibacillus apiarius TaxID=46240 RepID=UPI003B3A2194